MPALDRSHCRSLTRLVSSLALAVVVMAGAEPAAAQSPWLDPGAKTALQLEILKPDFEDADLSFTTSAWYLGGRTRLSASVSLVGELPFVTSGYDSDEFETEEDGLIVGNPYLGAQFGPATSVVRGDVGIRLPLTAEDNDLSSIVGMFADVQRLTAFTQEYWSLRALMTVQSQPAENSGLYGTVRLGPELALDAGDTGGDEEWLGLWALGGGIEQRSVRVRTEINGLTFLDGLDDGFTEASYIQFALGADFGAGRLRPGISLRAPLNDNLSSALGTGFGLSLQYVIP